MIFSPPAFSPPISENLKGSEFDDDQLMREEAKKAVEYETNLVGFEIERLKNGCKTKVEGLRRVKMEVKEELSKIREKYDQVQQQVGFNEGKAEFLARENEVLNTTNIKLQN